MKKTLGIVGGLLLAGILTFMGVFALSPKVRNSLLDSWGISYEKSEEDAPNLEGLPNPGGTADIPDVETITFTFEHGDFSVEVTTKAGYTWQEFIDSEDNTLPFRVDGMSLVYADFEGTSEACLVIKETNDPVYCDELIIADAVYDEYKNP